MVLVACIWWGAGGCLFEQMSLTHFLRIQLNFYSAPTVNLGLHLLFCCNSYSLEAAAKPALKPAPGLPHPERLSVLPQSSYGRDLPKLFCCNFEPRPA